MEIWIDEDVQAVMEFMQTHVPACKLIGVSRAIGQFAESLWGRYPQQSVVCAELRAPNIGDGIQPSATESLPVGCAGDDSAVVVRVPAQ